MKHEVAEPVGSAVGTRLALLSIVGFWLFYFVIVTIRSVVLDFDHQWELLGRRAIVLVIGVFITVGLYYALRPFTASTLGKRITAAALLCVPAALLMSTINWAAFYGIKPVEWDKSRKQDTIIIRKGDKSVQIGPPGAIPAPPAPPAPPSPDRQLERSVTIQLGNDHEEDKGPVMMIADNAANHYFFMAAWAALFLALCYAGEVGAAERRAARFRAAAQAAELRALRYQINPHFLFNTLNSLSSLVMRDNRDEAERMIMNLATFFRTSLTADPAEDVMLSEEIRLQRLYLDIEAVRFPDRLKVDIVVPPELATACVPALILQPLIENAVKYGVSRSKEPVTIRIRAREDSQGLVLSVWDDGSGTANGDTEPGTGLGLRNVRDRLAARFGEQAVVRWGPLPEGGFAVTLFMPLVRRGC
jgi:hypothetical protein